MVDVDLSQLREMHTDLTADAASIMIEWAALALQRNRHEPGVMISMQVANASSQSDYRGRR